MSVMLTKQGLFFVSNNARDYYVVLHNPCDTQVEFGQLSENPDIMRFSVVITIKYNVVNTS